MIAMNRYIAAWVAVLAGSVGRTGSLVAHPPLAKLPGHSTDALGAGSLKCDATSPLIEATACRVLRLVLRNGREAHISCSVKSDAFDLLQGKLRGASVRGRGWASRLGLTARNIDVDVGNVSLDVGALFRRRMLEFRTPHPSGNAIVVFNAEDFGNFLVHPLISRTVIAGRTFIFNRDGVAIDPNNRVVAFNGTWGEAQRLRITLSQANSRSSLIASVVGGANEFSEETADAIASGMARYFRGLEIDLDGPILSFSALSFQGRSVQSGALRLSLGIVVRKFPSIQTVKLF